MENKPYVFISYAHLDSDTVMPCVDMMKKNGINLWYDEGIEAGSEWPEFIAEKVVSCTKFVLFISNAYLNSQNCKRELNFAISRKKDILSIFLEDVALSPGVEMQLGTYQAIYRKRFENATTFHNSLCGESYFNVCRLSQASNTIPQSQPRTVHTPEGTYTTTNSYTAENLGATFGSFFNGGSTQAKPQENLRTALPVRNRVVAALLAIFLGGFGIHKFYLKQPWRGVLSLLFCWTYIPGIIGFIEGIVILCSSDEKFEKKYKCKTK